MFARSARRSSTWPWLAGWLLSVGSFAWLRAPYDDEWFSLVVARDLTRQQATAVLAGDIHPPWVAFLDRLLAAISTDPRAFRLLRLAPSAAAVLLLSVVVARRLRLRLPVVAAFHPIIFMYAACARWYPYLFLAQALRAWALWGTWRGGKRRAAFLIGGVLGPMAGYADLLFLLHDSVWLIVRQRAGKARTKSLLLLLLGMGAANLLVLALSPLSATYGSLFIRSGTRWTLAPQHALEWLGTGLLGQALPPGKWAALALVPIPAFVWAGVQLLRQPRTRRLGSWLALTIAGWCVVMAGGSASQPRYSLMVWFFAGASVLALARRRGVARAVAIAAIAYLAIALGLTVSERYFLKGDLNRLPASACRSLLDLGAYDLIVAPYPKTAWELSTICAAPAPIVSASWAAHYRDPDHELAELELRLRKSRRMLLVTVPARSGSLSETNARARQLVEARCSRIAEAKAVDDPHFALKSILQPDVTEWRYRAELWDCAAPP